MILTGRGLFSLGVALATLLLIILSLDLNEKSRLIPIVVGILLLGMSTLQFLGDTFPRISKRLPFVHQKGMLTASTEMTVNNGEVKLEEKKTKEVDESWLQIYKAFGLSIGFIILMYYTSYLIAIPVFLFLAIRLVSKARIIPTLWVVLITEIFMYILFDLILQVRF